MNFQEELTSYCDFWTKKYETWKVEERENDPEQSSYYHGKQAAYEDMLKQIEKIMAVK